MRVALFRFSRAFLARWLRQTPVFGRVGCMGLLLSVGLSLMSMAAGQTPHDPALARAQQLADQGQGQGARAIVEAFVQAHPNDYTALLMRSQLADVQGDATTARSTLNKLLRLYPGDSAALVTLARVLMRQALALDPPAEPLAPLIEEYLTQAALRNPDDPAMLVARGEWAMARNAMETAHPDLTRAVSLQPTLPEGYRALARYFLSTGQPRAAAEAGLHAMELRPDDSQTHFVMAQLLAAAQKPDQALAYAQSSQALDMGVNPHRTLFIVQLLETLGRPQEAVTAMEQLVREAPGYPEATLRLARLHASAQRPQEAARYYQQAFARNPALQDAVWNGLWRLIHARQADEALSQLEPFLFLGSAQQTEAFHAAASLLGQERDSLGNSAAQARRWLALLDAHAATLPHDNALLLLDRLTLSLVADPALCRAEATRVSAERLSQLPDTTPHHTLAAGEALFLLQRLAEARQRWEGIDGLSAQGFLRVADRLESLGALGSARLIADRSLALDATLGDAQAMRDRLAQRQQRATMQVADGNALFREKRYAEARQAYEQAYALTPDVDTPLLRLGDVYEQLGDSARAYRVYRRAVGITPTLLDSRGFAKKYRRLARRWQAQTPETVGLSSGLSP